MPLLTCQELVELVTNYLEGSLPPDQHARFEEHISICEACTAYLAQMRETIVLVGKLTEESLDPGTKEKLLQTFRDWKNGLSLSHID